jgi:pSer/pThr/pTyr-binding forkhead associated (FHA) protein
VRDHANTLKPFWHHPVLTPDIMEGRHMGRFGTLSVMKTSEQTVPVAHFPIDEEEITIGRDPSCSIRLYYETVSRLHCKITFQERKVSFLVSKPTETYLCLFKAFLVVLGASGLTADGCEIFPTASGPTTVPLGNESEIEVHRKIFRFTYPPKELRAILLSTPEPDRTRRRKTLRMSMIQCAQVFSPAPSHDPEENLRTLQSPIRAKFPSPLKPPTSDSLVEEEEVEDIVLVDGNQPDVFQDDEDDLVILENVHAPPAPANNPIQSVQFSLPAQHYQTPLRKPRNSLHRAVLIRSAQQLARKIELETEEAQEEKEVEEVVATLEQDRTAEGLEQLNDDDTSENRKEGLEDVPEEDKYRPLGPFMTPQANGGQSVHVGRGKLGYSVEGPRRVRIVQPWRVQDIVIPADTEVKQEFAPVFRKVSDEERMVCFDPFASLAFI